MEESIQQGLIHSLKFFWIFKYTLNIEKSIDINLFTIHMARRAKLPKLSSTQISISIPQQLVETIDQMAKNENRNRSNFILNAMQNIAKEFSEIHQNVKNKK